MTYQYMELKIKELEKRIEALEQEPCEDAISREAVHEAITRWAGSMAVLVALPTREVRPLLDSVHNLPSISIKPKTGHWIRQTDDYHDYYECEYCGIAVGLDDIKNFCPNCGARMVEPQKGANEWAL